MYLSALLYSRVFIRNWGSRSSWGTAKIDLKNQLPRNSTHPYTFKASSCTLNKRLYTPLPTTVVRLHRLAFSFLALPRRRQCDFLSQGHLKFVQLFSAHRLNLSNHPNSPRQLSASLCSRSMGNCNKPYRSKIHLIVAASAIIRDCSPTETF